MSTENLSIAEMGRQLRSGTVSSETLTRDALARIRDRDPRLHAFIRVTEQRALDDARKADADLKAGRDRGPMHGVPYALKDIYDTAGIATTCHSKLRQDHVPSEDLVVAARFAEGGAVLLGKLATHEFAIGGPSFDLPWPPARNPWNLDHITGGSSSGTGAAIAGNPAHGDGVRHGRVDPRAGRLVRHGRDQANIRTCLSPGRLSAVLVAGSHRPSRAERRRLCHRAAGDRGPRPAGPGQCR